MTQSPSIERCLSMAEVLASHDAMPPLRLLEFLVEVLQHLRSECIYIYILHPRKPFGFGMSLMSFVHFSRHGAVF